MSTLAKRALTVSGSGGALEGEGLGYGIPWKQQYEFNESTQDRLGSWSLHGTLPYSGSGLTVIPTKNRIYLFGNGREVYSATVNTTGDLGAWVREDDLLSTLISSSGVVTKNRIYLAGYGANDQLQTCEINPDGTLGPWEYAGYPPITSSGALGIRFLVLGERLFMFGGSTYLYCADIGVDGTLGPWTTYRYRVESVKDANIVVTGNYIYLLGYNSNYRFSITEDNELGFREDLGQGITKFQGTSTVVTKNTLFVVGGDRSTGSNLNFRVNLNHCTINPDGTLGTWGRSANLPGRIYNTEAVVLGDWLYMFGGYEEGGRGYLDTIYRTPFESGITDYTNYRTAGKPKWRSFRRVFTESGSFAIPSVATDVRVTGKGQDGAAAHPGNSTPYYYVYSWTRGLQTAVCGVDSTSTNPDPGPPSLGNYPTEPGWTNYFVQNTGRTCVGSDPSRTYYTFNIMGYYPSYFYVGTSDPSPARNGDDTLLESSVGGTLSFPGGVAGPATSQTETLPDGEQLITMTIPDGGYVEVLYTYLA